MSAAPGAGRPARDVGPAGHAGWLSSPVRRVVTDPKRIPRGLVEPGDTAVDLGCGPGFFTHPLVGMVGDGGSVIAVDLQPAMLEKVRVRAAQGSGGAHPPASVRRRRARAGRHAGRFRPGLLDGA